MKSTIIEILCFFRTNSVREKIALGKLTETHLFIYFYLIFMYDAFGLTQQCLSMIGRQANLLDLVNIWGYFIITGIGLLILFISNGGAQGKNFISKFFAFSFTVGYKYGIALILLDSFSKFIYPAHIQTYQISIYFIVNLLMVTNISIRIYQTRNLYKMADAELKNLRLGGV